MEYEPLHIKTTPPELGVPSHDIEWHDEAKVLAATTYNPGVPDAVFRKLAEKVVSELRTLNSKQWRTHLVWLAERYMEQPATEKVEKKTQEATHRIIDEKEIDEKYNTPWNDR
jgi:aldehyde:ferredoxin oxidoreductase